MPLDKTLNSLHSNPTMGFDATWVQEGLAVRRQRRKEKQAVWLHLWNPSARERQWQERCHGRDQFLVRA